MASYLIYKGSQVLPLFLSYEWIADQYDISFADIRQWFEVNGIVPPAQVDRGMLKRILTYHAKTATKACRECGQVLPIEDFGINNALIDGRTTTCKKCINSKYNKKRQTKPQNKTINQSNTMHLINETIRDEVLFWNSCVQHLLANNLAYLLKDQNNDKLQFIIEGLFKESSYCANYTLVNNCFKRITND